MRESCMYGSVRGAPSNERPYRDRKYVVERVNEAGQNGYRLSNLVDGSDHVIFGNISLEELQEYLWTIEMKDVYMEVAQQKRQPTES